MSKAGHGRAVPFSQTGLSRLKAPRHRAAGAGATSPIRPLLHPARFLHSHVDVFAPPHGHTLITVSTRARLARARLRGWAQQPPAFPYITEMLQAAENSKCCFNYVLYGKHPASWKGRLTTGLPGYLQWQKPSIHPNVSLKGKMSGLSVK